MSELLKDDNIDAVIIATRHDTHAKFTADALRAGKHVFVEKPLALTVEQLDDVIAAKDESSRIVMPGYIPRKRELRIAGRIAADRHIPAAGIAHLKGQRLRRSHPHVPEAKL